MTTEGHFTSDEIQAAVNMGATIKPLMFGRTAIHFETEEVYDRWASEQALLHPERWSHCMRIPARKSESIPHL